MKSRSLVVLCALVLGAPASAAAADPPVRTATEEGREHFKRGVDLFRDGDFRAALIEFTRANAAAPSRRIQFNIAQTCLELQDYVCALHAFERYLAGGGSEVPKDRQSLSEREIERLRKLVGQVRVSSNKDGASVVIDDLVVGPTPLVEPITVGAGRHRIAVYLSPFPSVHRIVDVAGGDKLDVEVLLDERTPAVGPPVTPPVPASLSARAAAPPTPPPAPLPPSRTPFWIGLATTGGLTMGTALTGALTLSAKSRLDTTAGRLGATTDDVDSARSNVRTLSTVTDVLLVTTIVAAAITTALYIVTSPAARAPNNASGLSSAAGVSP